MDVLSDSCFHEWAAPCFFINCNFLHIEYYLFIYSLVQRVIANYKGVILLSAVYTE